MEESNNLVNVCMVTALLEKAQNIDKAMKGVGHSVRKSTEEAQKPRVESSLIVDFALFDDECKPPASSIEQLRAGSAGAIFGRVNKTRAPQDSQSSGMISLSRSPSSAFGAELRLTGGKGELGLGNRRGRGLCPRESGDYTKPSSQTIARGRGQPAR
jgi:hypothetical protein